MKVLLEDDKNKVVPKEENELEKLFIKGIFEFKKLEYVSRMLAAKPELLNIEVEDEALFLKVIKEYLISLRTNNEEERDYYLRIINKFLIEEGFDLNNSLKNDCIKVLSDSSKKDNISCDKKIEISKLINAINHKENIFPFFRIDNKNAKSSLLDVDYNKRMLINDYIMTVDDEDTFVLDDGLSFSILPNGNILFKVHIADPLAYVPFFSRAMIEASKKGATIYLSDTQLPMLNHRLSGDKMSLVLGKKRLAKTLFYELDTNFDIVNFYIKDTVIKVSERASYNTLNSNYQKGGTSNDEYLRLKTYERILKTLKTELKNLDSERIKAEVNLGKNRKMGNFAEDLVAYSMVFSGKKMAEYFKEHDYPFVYRSHMEDLAWKDELLKCLNKPIDTSSYRILKGFVGSWRAFYSLTNYGHEGLELDTYSHTTSPLRRFADVLNWLSYDTFYDKDFTDEDVNWYLDIASKICQNINNQRDTTEDYIHFYEKVKEKTK